MFEVSYNDNTGTLSGIFADGTSFTKTDVGGFLLVGAKTFRIDASPFKTKVPIKKAPVIYNDIQLRFSIDPDFGGLGAKATDYAKVFRGKISPGVVFLRRIEIRVPLGLECRKKGGWNFVGSAEVVFRLAGRY